MTNGAISKGRIAFFAGAALISFAAAFFFGAAWRDAEKPAEYTGVVFSVLAASLFAVVSILGDPSMILPGSSRRAWVSARELQKELQRFNLLFVWYLLTLGLLVISELIESAKMEHFYWVGNVLVFFTSFGFLVSLGLPREFARIQRRRLQQEIEARNGSSKGKSICDDRAAV